MSAISSVASSVDYAQQYLDYTNQILASGNVSADTITAQAEAEVLAEAEAAILKQALTIEQSQSQQLIDLLV